MVKPRPVEQLRYDLYEAFVCRAALTVQLETLLDKVENLDNQITVLLGEAEFADLKVGAVDEIAKKGQEFYEMVKGKQNDQG